MDISVHEVVIPGTPVHCQKAPPVPSCPTANAFTLSESEEADVTWNTEYISAEAPVFGTVYWFQLTPFQYNDTALPAVMHALLAPDCIAPPTIHPEDVWIPFESGFNGPPKFTASSSHVVGELAWFHANPSQKNMKPLSLTAQPLPLPLPLVPPLMRKIPCMFEAGLAVYSVGFIKRH